MTSNKDSGGYGGYWKAVPVSPAGFITNSLYGRSTNQEMLNGPVDARVDIDDYIFLRPTQSESVMLQFGDLVIIRGGEMVGRWPVFSQCGVHEDNTYRSNDVESGNDRVFTKSAGGVKKRKNP